MKNYPDKKIFGYNRTFKKMAFLCYAETFLVYGNLVPHNYIRAESRQLIVAAEHWH
jgi:hypothetical protein